MKCLCRSRLRSPELPRRFQERLRGPARTGQDRLRKEWKDGFLQGFSPSELFGTTTGRMTDDARMHTEFDWELRRLFRRPFGRAVRSFCSALTRRFRIDGNQTSCRMRLNVSRDEGNGLSDVLQTETAASSPVVKTSRVSSRARLIGSSRPAICRKDCWSQMPLI